MGIGSIFIGYRRSDTQQPAGRLYERLKTEFGQPAVFYDTESMGIGTHFPSELQSALGRSSVVLAVIGNGWRQALIDNSKLADKTDYVREELKQACARLQAGDPLLLVPVLINGSSDLSPDGLPDGVKADLQALFAANALTFTPGSWDAEFKRLTTCIRQFETDHPGPHKSRRQRVEEINAGIHACLADPVLAVLAQKWRPALEDLQKADAASVQIWALESALTAALPALKVAAQAIPAEPPQALCLQITALLASLAVDAGAARAELDRSGAVPSKRKGIAALVRAVAREQRMVLLPGLDGSDAKPDRTAIANVALDAGVGEPWTMDIAAQFWNQLHPGDLRASSDSRLLTDLGVLAAKLKQRAQREGMSFVVLCESDFKNREAVQAAARRLNAEPLLLASAPPGARPVLTEPEDTLVAAMSDCIHVIGKLS